MLLSVGELAKRCGLTVRTLHHYDAIGLLVPSSRSDAGYRLYGRQDIERLHRIQALRRLGLSLADIGTALSGSDMPLTEVIDRQLAQIECELTQAQRLKRQLIALREQLVTGQSPDLAHWLDTLELMTMYEKYFSPEELQRFPMLTQADSQAEWVAMVGMIQSLVDRGTPPDAHEAQILALRWMTMLGRDTGGNADFLNRLDKMYTQEPALQALSRITPEVHRFVRRAVMEARMAIYARYLTPEELAFARAHYLDQMDDWPPLIAALQREIAAGTPADAPAAMTLAQRWLELFRGYAGDDPATHRRFRQAHENEPELLAGSFVTPALLDYVRQIFQAIAASRTPA
ncbi:MAG TPA: MerR family transcriptional regulator [Dyella sp.]|uniref:MerR family transcriptional regulator n=1 Tax=Dyella sp. TaxID=1869338 RepID=UPI002F93FB9D